MFAAVGGAYQASYTRGGGAGISGARAQDVTADAATVTWRDRRPATTVVKLGTGPARWRPRSRWPSAPTSTAPPRPACGLRRATTPRPSAGPTARGGLARGRPGPGHLHHGGPDRTRPAISGVRTLAAARRHRPRQLEDQRAGDLPGAVREGRHGADAARDSTAAHPAPHGRADRARRAPRLLDAHRLTRLRRQFRRGPRREAAHRRRRAGDADRRGAADGSDQRDGRRHRRRAWFADRRRAGAGRSSPRVLDRTEGGLAAAGPGRRRPAGSRLVVSVVPAAPPVPAAPVVVADRRCGTPRCDAPDASSSTPWTSGRRPDPRHHGCTPSASRALRAAPPLT